MLELIKAEEVFGKCYHKKYKYGFFVLNIMINPDGTIQIEAKDELNEEIKISAIDDHQATMSVTDAFLYSELTVLAFMTKMKQAKELYLIIENDREQLIRREN